MFIFARRSSNVYSFIINVVRHFLKKSFTQFNNRASILLFRMLCSNRACETLSNVFDTFKLSRNVNFFLNYFKLCESFSLSIVVLCQRIVVFWLSFMYSTTLHAFRQHIKCVSILLTSTSCSMCSTALSIYTT